MRLPLARGCLLLFLVVARFSLSSSHRLMRLFNFSGVGIVWTEAFRERSKKGQGWSVQAFYWSCVTIQTVRSISLLCDNKTNGRGER